MFLLIDNYDSFTYNLYALFTNLGARIEVIKNTEYRSADDYSGIIISPGPSSPSNSGTTLKYLSDYIGEKPIFGVCLGMQSIAYSLGCPVGRAPEIKHGKLDRIRVTGESVLFRGLPESFNIVRYHSLAVTMEDRFVTSRSDSDGVIMSIEDREKKFFGVQFHPESVLSEHGEAIARNFYEFVTGGGI
ncbi:MAG: aminodeoxychorismate/anthranilate synthase component II [Spirochaetes bacterium]|jgi:anthranilate synthase component 2|nr:aminodeoxychorismate/anthranilate synthase component II [Spirochaetota bacterium]